jgi:3-(3-hydroxy-phenyl)propionate hydroxylase
VDSAVPACADIAASERDGVLADWFAKHGCRAALVRPDHYVFGTAGDAAALDALLDELRAGLAPGATAFHQPQPITAIP